MNLLYLAHRIPYPPNKGDKIRSFNEIKYLSQKYSIYLVSTLDEPGEEEYLPELEKYCKDIHAVYFNRKARLFSQIFKPFPFSVLSFFDQRIQNYVEHLLANVRFEAVIVFCSSMAQYIINSENFRNGPSKDARLIIDFVDMDSDKWRQYAQYSPFPWNLIYHLENKRLFKYEVFLNSIFDKSVFASDREVKAFLQHHPEAKEVLAIPNGVDYNFFYPAGNSPDPVTSLPKQGSCLLFTGVMDYFANEDGVIWFCEKIFPKIRTDIPEAEFFIVGNRPTDMVWALTELDGVTVTGFVEDVRPYYWLADVCVVPLRIARGLQNKVLEAMATGNAVVATSNASDGIICKDGEDIIIADQEEIFAEAVITLLHQRERIDNLARCARGNITRNYCWENNLQAIEQLLT